MASDVRPRGVPVDRVGLRAHLGGSGPPGTVQTMLASAAAPGVDVRITELDIAPIPLSTRLAGSAVGEPQRKARSGRTPAAAR
jgi:GH35 family endo-1,4-beta-xylanase